MQVLIAIRGRGRGAVSNLHSGARTKSVVQCEKRLEQLNKHNEMFRVGNEFTARWSETENS